MATRQKYLRIRILLTVMLIFCIAACGKQADTYPETEPVYSNEDMEDGAEAETGIEEAATENAAGEEAADMMEDTTTAEDEATDTIEDPTAADEPEAIPSEAENVITVYASEDIEYSDEVVPVQYVDDLSMLENMKFTNSTYVYQDGNVYYRRYHEDSYEEAAFEARYDYYPIPGTQKEIVCIDSAGKVTELFADEGYGDIYLVNDRFYMADGELNIESHTGLQLYSVDMQGNNRIDYGSGRIFAIDRERKVMILQMWEAEDGSYWRTDSTRYYAMNYETGERKSINFDDSHISIKAYQDGWLYYTKYDSNDDAVQMLCAVSLEGEQREVLALTSDKNKDSYPYNDERILHAEVDKDRIYFIFGGYDGSAQMFQGGTLISVKLDGTDYRAMEIQDDYFYLSHNNGNPLIYFPHFRYSFASYGMAVWDINANICRLTDFPERILSGYGWQMGTMWRYYPAEKGAFYKWSIYEDHLYGDDPQMNIYAVPDDSGKVVRVVMDLGDHITKWRDEETCQIQYEDLYYADGFLYFTAEYSAYEETASVGWREGYRRQRSEVYRLKIGERTAKMLYSY